MKIARAFAHCQWLVLINETDKLKSFSDRSVRILIQYGWRKYHKTMVDRRWKIPKNKKDALDLIFQTIEALNNEQCRRLESEEHGKILHALANGTFFRRAGINKKIVSFPFPPTPSSA